ncbi:MAG: glycosyltransferase family 2 protein [Candidatus Omnitrophota bacterium]|nr:glycosyltransferase family 2 protein [Candidatus Omnitrophota bacterium]
MNKTDIFIVIPAYNESKTIGPIVNQLCQRGFRVIVVDDGSKDKTMVEANKYGAELIVHAKNTGKGLCIREGLEYALENNCEAVITMDGDGQHSLKDVDKFIEEYKKSGADLVLGNRLHDPKKMPFIRWCANVCMSFIVSMIITKNINDTQCGYRMISRKGIEKMKLNTVKYEIESEMITEASRRGLKMSSVNIESIYENEISQINPFLDTMRFVRFIISEYPRK